MTKSLTQLLDYSRSVGPLYGTEDFAIFLYALIKMQRPERLLELGTGTGVCTFWAAQGMKENGVGTVLTVDDGSHWEHLKTWKGLKPRLARPDMSYHDFLTGMAKRFSVEDRIEFVSASMPPFPTFEVKVDILFSDFEHHPSAILKLFRHFLPLMSSASSIFIDSASTFLPSYLLLERLITQFNQGKVPRAMLQGLPEEKAAALMRHVQAHQFTLVHLTEAKQRDQNSTAWIKIEPIDVIPHPATRMR